MVSASDREQLEKALAECYKQLRKAQKEEFDPVITAILEGKEVVKKAEGPISFEGLEQKITLYRALDLVEWVGDDELWIEVYKYGLANKVTPRDRLKAMYQEKKNHVIP